ncbi:4765_t:CDS:2, partial [Diversispora eburnea]
MTHQIQIMELDLSGNELTEFESLDVTFLSDHVTSSIANSNHSRAPTQINMTSNMQYTDLYYQDAIDKYFERPTEPIFDNLTYQCITENLNIYQIFLLVEIFARNEHDLKGNFDTYRAYFQNVMTIIGNQLSKLIPSVSFFSNNETLILPPDQYHVYSILTTLNNNQDLYQRLLKVEYIIIEESSMVASQMLTFLSTLFGHIKKNHLEFGGISVLLTGDLFQLPSVQGDLIFYSPNGNVTENSIAKIQQKVQEYYFTDNVLNTTHI